MCNELNMSRILEINGMRTPGIFNTTVEATKKRAWSSNECFRERFVFVENNARTEKILEN